MLSNYPSLMMIEMKRLSFSLLISTAGCGLLPLSGAAWAFPYVDPMVETDLSFNHHTDLSAAAHKMAASQQTGSPDFLSEHTQQSATDIHDPALPGISAHVAGLADQSAHLGQLLNDTQTYGLVGAVIKHSAPANAEQLSSDDNGKVFLTASPATASSLTTATASAATSLAATSAQTSLTLSSSPAVTAGTNTHEIEDGNLEYLEHLKHGNDDSPTKLLEQTVVTGTNLANNYAKTSLGYLGDNDSDTQQAELQEQHLSSGADANYWSASGTTNLVSSPQRVGLANKAEKSLSAGIHGGTAHHNIPADEHKLPHCR